MTNRLPRLALVALLAAPLAHASLAEAAPRAPHYGRVTAFSHYGNGSVTGAVRPTRLGYEVQTPKGSWLDCQGDCQDTLRRWALDFWESRDEDAPDGDRR